eukprot:6214494-Pleurochrysis_carterae.AAC.2
MTSMRLIRRSSALSHGQYMSRNLTLNCKQTCFVQPSRLMGHCVSRDDFNIQRCRDEVASTHALADLASGGGEVSWEQPHARWHWLDGELSSNIAGETGAVYIYRGAASALSLRESLLSRAIEPDVSRFVHEHMEAEAAHLELFELLLPQSKRTRLLPVWRLSGWVLGFAPALVSPRALYLTVQAVETFVEEHYMEQIVPLEQQGRCPELVKLLRACCADEVHHKDDAADRAQGPPGLLERAWMAVVRKGSAVAAEVARRI